MAKANQRTVSGKQNDICACGHKRSDHRSRGQHPCRKRDCSCKAFQKLDDTPPASPEPHVFSSECRCGECAWTRLLAIEGRLDALEGDDSGEVDGR